MLPAVSLATTSFVTLFTASSSSIQYLSISRVPTDYGVVFFFIAMTAAALGELAIVGPIKRRKKVFVLVFILAGVLICSLVLLVVTGAMRVEQSYRAGQSMGFRSLCVHTS